MDTPQPSPERGPLPPTREADPLVPASPTARPGGAASPESLPGRPAGHGRRTGALLELLGDPSETVWRAVRGELEGLLAPGACSPASRLALARRLHRLARAGGARERARARWLLLGLDRARAARRMIRFAMGPDPDLERGLLLLSRFEQPGLDLRPFLLALDAMGAEAARRVESLPPTARRARVLVEYLGLELGYGGDDEDLQHPDNVYLHRAIVRKRGMPLTLCALYSFVARRAGLRSSLVALPGHVVLRLHGEDRPLLVDPFNHGAELTERECLHYLAGHGLPFQPGWFADAADGAMFLRQLRNLRGCYARRGLRREVAQIERVLAVARRRFDASWASGARESPESAGAGGPGVGGPGWSTREGDAPGPRPQLPPPKP